MPTTDLDKLLRQYIERFESGGAVDPSDLLLDLEGPDRAELSALIDGYLEFAAPKQEWDPEAFEGSVAERATRRVQEDWEAEASALPAQLVALRKQAKLERSSLVKELAEKLGAAKQQGKVGVYYNAMEHGQLDPQGISSKVFDALASILGTSAEALRRAGEAVAPSAGGEPGPAFARTIGVPNAPAQAEAASPGEPDEQTAQTRKHEQPDEVDRLFTGGG